MNDQALLQRGFPIRFDQVQPHRVAAAVDQLLEDAQKRMQAVIDQPDPRTFENTMRAVEAITERLEHAMGVVGHLEATATSDALREAYNAAQPRVSELTSRIPLSSELYQTVKSYADSVEARGLSGARARFVRKTLSFFRRHGAELDEAGKKRLAEIEVQLTKLTLRFSQNVLDATNAFELMIEQEDQLSGLPESAIQAAAQSARAKGKDGWRFTLQAPSLVPLLTYLDDAAVRERMYRAMISRATSGKHDNRPIVRRVIELRREKAELLGYATFADLVLEERMAKSGGRARDFIDGLHDRSKPFFDKETDQLWTFRRELEGSEAPAPRAWDLAYYAEKLRRKLFAFDAEALRPYFGFTSVMDGLFEIARRLFGVRFEPWNDAPSWHPSVRAFKVLDDEDDSWLAGIYLDPFPRETKHAGAWMDGLLARGQDEDDHRHIGVLVANLTPPIGDAEAQLSHGEVETLFHELGHLMHHCLSRARLRSQAGTRVAWDFVELPSQMLENWCWEREALDLFAHHRDDGAPIPDELLAAMRRARTFRAASQQMRQLGFATADLTLHTATSSAAEVDPIEVARDVMQRFSAAELPPEHAMMASFDHLFGSPVGYAAGYYSYKWAEVLDADAFTRFAAAGLFDADTGRAFRRKILARGDEADPAQLFRDFMGRDPELGALLERLGLIESGQTP